MSVSVKYIVLAEVASEVLSAFGNIALAELLGSTERDPGHAISGYVHTKDTTVSAHHTSADR